VSGTQDKRLAVRFYNDCNTLLFIETSNPQWGLHIMDRGNIGIKIVWRLFRWGVMKYCNICIVVVWCLSLE
jgi:hypothetical protein